MSDPLLKIANHHAPSCGDPPIVEGITGNCYIGYFENSHGEQWIFTLDRATGKATLRGGDNASRAADFATRFDQLDLSSCVGGALTCAPKTWSPMRSAGLLQPTGQGDFNTPA